MGSAYSTLKQRDPHNQTLAILLLIFLTQAKRYPRLRLLHSYTFWNISSLIVGKLLGMGWERPIFTNSVAILLSYKSASIDNYDGLFARSGMSSHQRYAIGDFIVHYLPIIILLFELVKNKKYIRPQIGAFSLLAMVHFSYSQTGSLNVSQVYVKHDHLFSWASALTGHLFSPYVVNNLIARKYARAFEFFLLTLSPVIIKSLGVVSWPRKQLEILAPLTADDFVCDGCRPILCKKCRGKEDSRRKSERNFNPLGFSI